MAKSIKYSYWRRDYDVQTSIPRVFSHPTIIIDEEEDCPEFYSDGTLRRYEPHCAFFHTLSGYGECWRGDERRRIGPGDSFLTVINDPASGYGYPADGTENWRFRVFCFDGANTRSEVTALLDYYGSKYRLAEDSPFLRELKPQPDWEVGKSLLMSPSRAHALVQMLYSELLVSAKCRALSKYPPIVNAAIELMQQRSGEAFQVSEIAEALGISREYLSRLFKRHLGIALTDYAHRQQALYVCRMLRYTRYSVRHIAENMGYENPSGLTIMFKRVMKQTPSEFRSFGYMPDWTIG